MKFFVIGDVTVDLIHFLERIPSAGEDATPERSALLPGGAGGTLAYYLALLGHEVSLAARVGTDPFRVVALENVTKVGVGLTALQTDAGRMTSSVTILVTKNAERTMISATGANRHLDAALLEPRAIAQSAAVVISAYALMEGAQREYTLHAMTVARAAGVPIFIDLGTGAVNAAGTALLEAVKGADYLLMNQLELFRITGQNNISAALEGLKAQGLKTVVIKVGALGAILWTPAESELLEGYSVQGVVDTTGAGDGFTAAFAHAVLSGYPLPDAVRYANIAGALVATSIGAQGSAMTDAEIVKRLRDTHSSRTETGQETASHISKQSPKKVKTAKLEPTQAPLEPLPVVTEPVVTEPVVTEPVVTQPIAVKTPLEPVAPVKRTRKKA